MLAVKSKGDGDGKFKARFVVGGHRDKLKRLTVYIFQTIQASLIRLLLAVVVMKEFYAWSSDVR